MQPRLQIITAVILLILLVYIIKTIRSRKLEIKYALIWIAAIILLLIFDLCPPVMEWLADISGVATPSNWLFATGFIFFVVIVLSITVAISKLAADNKMLAQELGLMRRQVELLEKKLEESQRQNNEM